MIRTIIRRQIIIQNYLKGINNNSSMELLNAGFQDTLKNDETTESIEGKNIQFSWLFLHLLLHFPFQMLKLSMQQRKI